jgi:hypothetical protein
VEASVTHTPCHEKKRYDTRVDAQTALVHCRYQGFPMTHYYRCDTCAGWHLTTTTTRDAKHALGIAVAALQRCRENPSGARLIAKDALDQIGAA